MRQNGKGRLWAVKGCLAVYQKDGGVGVTSQRHVFFHTAPLTGQLHSATAKNPRVESGGRGGGGGKSEIQSNYVMC